MTDDGWALPESLRGRAFTSREAASLGVGPRRLRGDRAQQLHHGIWADAAAELSLSDRARAALGTADELAWIGHATAAALHELALPPRLRELDRIDVTVPSPMHAPRGRGIRGRQRTLELTALALLGDLRVASPAQAFVDGCDYLAFEDLVALGDSVVWERSPQATRAALLQAIGAHRGRRAHRRLVAAAASVHPRSGSRPETITRLQLQALGVPEPWCNVPVVLDAEEPIAPDIAFWQARLIIEVEGDQHRVDRKQWLTDLDRYNRVQRSEIELHRVVATTRSRRDVSSCRSSTASGAVGTRRGSHHPSHRSSRAPPPSAANPGSSARERLNSSARTSRSSAVATQAARMREVRATRLRRASRNRSVQGRSGRSREVRAGRPEGRWWRARRTRR